MEHWRGETEEIDVISSEENFFARPALHLFGRNELGLPSLVFTVDRLDRSIGVETQCDRETPPRGDRVHEDGVTGIISDLSKPDGGGIAFTGEPADRAQLEIPAHRLGHDDEVPRAPQKLHELPIVAPGHTAPPRK